MPGISIAMAALHSRCGHYILELVSIFFFFLFSSPSHILSQGRNHWGVGEVRNPKIWTENPNFLDEEGDYRYVTDCSARNRVYHPYFVLYNNIDQEIRPPQL